MKFILTYFLISIFFLSFAQSKGLIDEDVLGNISNRTSIDEINELRWEVARELTRYFINSSRNVKKGYEGKDNGEFESLLSAHTLYKNNAYKVFDVYVNRSGPTVEKIIRFIGWWELHKSFDETLWLNRCKSIGSLVEKVSIRINEHYSTPSIKYYSCLIGDNLFVD